MPIGSAFNLGERIRFTFRSPDRITALDSCDSSIGGNPEGRKIVSIGSCGYGTGAHRRGPTLGGLHQDLERGARRVAPSITGELGGCGGSAVELHSASRALGFSAAVVTARRPRCPSSRSTVGGRSPTRVACLPLRVLHRAPPPCPAAGSPVFARPCFASPAALRATTAREHGRTPPHPPGRRSPARRVPRLVSRRRCGPCKGRDDLELATLEYIGWFNHRRLTRRARSRPTRRTRSQPLRCGRPADHRRHRTAPSNPVRFRSRCWLVRSTRSAARSMPSP